MNLRYTAACIAVAPFLLGGCSVMHKLGFGHPRGPAQAAAQPNPDGAARFTAEGRRDLDAGNFGLAIESFQRALDRGEPRAAALNGLGVAYARLGRSDTSEQLFRQAMEADPATLRYAENLNLLLKARGEAGVQQAAAPVPEPQSPVAPEAVSAAAPVVAVAPPQVDGRLFQVAPRQFAIRTVRTEPDSGRGVKVAAGFRPIVRVALRPASPPAPAVPSATPARGKPR